jgi:hypothetical protein
LARRSLKPQLNQIRTWVRQGRTDAWIAHQLEVSVGDIRAFKREHDLAPADAAGDGDGEPFAASADDEEQDLRAEDDALVAAALEAEEDEAEEDEAEEDEAEEDEAGEDEDEGERPRRRRRGRRGGRGRRRRPKGLEGTFDHGEEGYGLWLDPAVQDDPVYAEHWAGHRPVMVTVEPDRIVISRAGDESDDDEDDD